MKLRPRVVSKIYCLRYREENLRPAYLVSWIMSTSSVSVCILSLGMIWLVLFDIMRDWNPDLEEEV